MRLNPKILKRYAQSLPTLNPNQGGGTLPPPYPNRASNRTISVAPTKLFFSSGDHNILEKLPLEIVKVTNSYIKRSYTWNN
jgi:hypothetical protein